MDKLFYLWSSILLLLSCYFFIKENDKFNKMACIVIFSNSISIIFWIMTILAYFMEITFLPKVVSRFLMLISIILLVLLILFIRKIRKKEN